MSEAEQRSNISLASVGSPPEGQGDQGASVDAPIPIMRDSGQNGPVDSSPEGARVKGPRAGRREAWVDIPDPMYEGFKFKMWVNYPQKLDQKIKANASEEEIAEALNKIILEHNGWRDDEDEEYPPANTVEFWKQIPTELAAAIVALAKLESTNLPNLIIQRRNNTRRG